MKKIPWFGYLIFFIGFFVYGLLFLGVNNLRINTVKRLDSEILRVVDWRSKTLLLVKSNLLSPSEEKSNKIIELYYMQRLPQKAESYFKFLPKGQRNLRLAEHFLSTGQYREYDLIAKNLTLQEKSELDRIKMVLSGKMEFSFAEEPLTDLGKIMLGINQRHYKSEGQTYIDVLLGSVKEPKMMSKELAISAVLLESDQPYLARFILNRLAEENPGNKHIYLLLAKTYESEKQYPEALKEAKKAFVLDPTDIVILKTIINYAETINNQSETVYYKSVLREIENIK